MKRGRFEKPRPKANPLWFVLVVLIFLLIGGCFFFLRGKHMPPAAHTEEASQAGKTAGAIAIPGFEGLDLVAGQKKQTLAFANPEQNSCYFRLTLMLEDGTVLWVSKPFAPGKQSDNVVLTQKLEAGVYPKAVLKYECFAMDQEMSPLNGAETKLTLWVK